MIENHQFQQYTFYSENSTNMNSTYKILSQEQAISAVRGQLFIIGSIAPDGTCSISTNPVAQYTKVEARKEAKRLATANLGRVFFITQFVGAEYVPASQTISI